MLTPKLHARLTAFVSEHARTPKASRSVPREELLLGSQVSGFRSRDKDGTLPECTADQLDKICPGWRTPGTTDNDPKWTASFENLATHLVEHEEIPRGCHLAGWLRGQLQNMDSPSFPEHRRELMMLLGDWDNFARLQFVDLTAWRATLAELGDWRDEHHRLPSTRATEQPERRLAFWLRRQRGLLRAGELLDIQARELRATPGWSGRASGGAGSGVTRKANPILSGRFTGRVEELERFVVEHGRLPRYNVADELSLYHWTEGVRRQYRNGSLKPSAAELLDSQPALAELGDWREITQRTRRARDAA